VPIDERFREKQWNDLPCEEGVLAEREPRKRPPPSNGSHVRPPSSPHYWWHVVIYTNNTVHITVLCISKEKHTTFRAAKNKLQRRDIVYNCLSQQWLKSFSLSLCVCVCVYILYIVSSFPLSNSATGSQRSDGTLYHWRVSTWGRSITWWAFSELEDAWAGLQSTPPPLPPPGVQVWMLLGQKKESPVKILVPSVPLLRIQAGNWH